MGNDQSKTEYSKAEGQREAEKLVEFCQVWLEDSDDAGEVRSAILAFLALEQACNDESGK